MVNFENGNWPSAIDADFDSEFSRRRIARQNNNRRPAINARLQRPSTNGEDVFGGLDPNPGGFNNQQFGQNQGQWFNNNNNGNQRPNQQQQQQQGFRPPNQNGQWSAGNNGGNQGQVSNQNQGQSSNNGGVSENERNACNSRCKERVTNEYNPVCGSDSVTYQNRRFLECAADCGISK